MPKAKCTLKTSSRVSKNYVFVFFTSRVPGHQVIPTFRPRTPNTPTFVVGSRGSAIAQDVHAQLSLTLVQAILRVKNSGDEDAPLEGGGLNSVGPFEVK